MARVYFDRVMQKITTVGTGNLDLGDDVAIPGFTRFNAVCADSDTFDYAVFAVDAAGVPTGQWETGAGEWSSFEIIRTPQRGSAGDATLVDFAAGDKYVMLSHNSASLEAGGGGGAGALVKLEEVAANGVDPYIQFLTIPTTGYSDLVIEFVGQATDAADDVDVYLQIATFSGGFTSSVQRLLVAGAAVTGTEDLGVAYGSGAVIGKVPGSTAPADAAGTISIDVPRFLEGMIKTFTARGGCNSGAGAGETKSITAWGTFNITETVIGVTIGLNGAAFTTDTKATLYGRT